MCMQCACACSNFVGTYCISKVISMNFNPHRICNPCSICVCVIHGKSHASPSFDAASHPSADVLCLLVSHQHLPLREVGLSFLGVALLKTISFLLLQVTAGLVCFWCSVPLCQCTWRAEASKLHGSKPLATPWGSLLSKRA